MTLRNSWPGPSGVTTTTDARIVVGGIVEDAAGVARAGIFPSTLNAIVTARSDMNVDIAAFTGVAVQFGGPIFIGNDGTIQLPAVLVSPASGTNYYVIYAKQDEHTPPGTDADDLPKVGNVLSTVSFAAARSSLPTGALELATVQVPSGVSATNAVGVTITQTFLYTAAEGGVVPVRNSTELGAWTPADGSLAYEIDILTLYVRAGGAWVGAAAGGSYTPTMTGVTVGNGTLVSSWSQTGKVVTVTGSLTLGSTSAVSGSVQVSLPVPANALYGAANSNFDLGSATFLHHGAQLFYGRVTAQVSTSQVYLFQEIVSGTNVVFSALSATAPWTWGASDIMSWTFSYIAA